jgi:hypothetical protein
MALCEVVRYITRIAGRQAAEQVGAQMQRTQIVDLDSSLAALAARLG